jgi:hypothetical protein
MYRYSIQWIVISILLGGCQSGPSALDRAATMVAETVAAAPPTDTPLSASTPLPVDLPKPFPTVTPNIALTATLDAMSVLSELDVLVGSNSDFPYGEGYLAWKQIEPVTIDMSGPQKDAGILQGIDESLNAANFIFKSNVTWNASGVLICGLAYRAEEDLKKGKQYQFYFYRLSGLPAYKIDVYDFGRFKNTITGVKFSDGVDDTNGASNEFTVVAQDERFTVYINGQRQGDYYDNSKQRVDGLLAFLGWQDSGTGSCTFEKSWVWVLP